MKFKLRRKNIRVSSTLKLARTQKIYMVAGFITSLVASLLLFFNAQNAGERQEVWMTKKAIGAGELITESSLELIKVDLGLAEDNYLGKDSQVIGKNSLVPLKPGVLLDVTNVGTKTNLRSVALRISNGRLPPFLQTTDWVDVWFSDPITLTSTLIIPKLSVVWIDEVNSNFGGVTTVVVAVPEANVLQLVNSARADGLDLVQREN